jgi:hypothetical protein
MIYELQAEIKAKELEMSAAKDTLEQMHASGVLEELGWLADDGRINTAEFTALRQVRKVWSYSEETQSLKAELKKAEAAEQKSGLAQSSPGAISWVFRKNKEV